MDHDERRNAQLLKQKRKMKEERSQAKLSPAGLFFIKLTIVVIVFTLLHVFIFGACRISGNQMYPSLRDGDFCIFYKLEPYHTGDVVQYQDSSGAKHIGRIIAMEGTFDLSNGNVPMINGMEIPETAEDETSAGSYPLPVTLKQNEYWIMNDNRQDKADSRNFGPIKKKDLRGKVLFLFRRRGF